MEEEQDGKEKGTREAMIRQLYGGLRNIYNNITRNISRKVHVRCAYEHELSVLGEFTVQEAWHVSDHVIKACFALDSKGIFIAVNDRNEPLGYLAACNLDDTIAFFGLAVIRKDMRGQGLSNKLWSEAVKHVGNRNIVGNSTLDTLELNRRRIKEGFFERDIRVYIGFPNVQNLKQISMNTRRLHLVELSENLFPRLVDYDQSIHLVRREQFLKRFLHAENATTLLAQQDENVIGYGCFYKRRNLFYSIAPLFADDRTIATILLNNLLLMIKPRSLVAFDMPISDNEFPELVESYGFRCLSKAVRISKREHPPVPWNKVFFLTTTSVSLV